MGEPVKVPSEPDAKALAGQALYDDRHPRTGPVLGFEAIDHERQADYTARAQVIAAPLIADKDARIAELERRLNKALDLAIETVGLANALARGSTS